MLLQNCANEFEACRPELKATLNEGNDLLSEVYLSDSESRRVKDELTVLERYVSNIERQLADERGR